MLTQCRICGNSSLTDVIDLGEQIITSRFPTYGDFSTPSTPIVICFCDNCSLAQLRYTTESHELYEHEYGYRSGISNTMREHLLNYQKEIMEIAKPCPGDWIVDIGSNDSTMLQYYGDDYHRVGVDPTGKQFKEYYGDKIALIPTYFNLKNFRNVYANAVCSPKVVSSISMFYDLPDPVQFAKDIYEILAPNGIWTCEQSYVKTMIERNSIDTICHEHLEYYSLKAVKTIADMAGFKIIHIGLNECNGGSFRLYFAKRENMEHEECVELIIDMLEKEAASGIHTPDVYTNFVRNCEKEVDKLLVCIDAINASGQEMYIYGASTKGNCLLQFANIGSSHIKYAVERNPKKIGKMTSTGIEIISEETMRKSPPEFLLVLPWHFREEIIEREAQFLENGGQLVFPFPTFEIYSKKEKVLITGHTGFIGKHVVDKFNKISSNYNLYGLARTLRPVDTPIVQMCVNAEKEASLLELYVLAVKPDIIIHLAGISNAVEAFENPISAIELNGLMIARICDIVHKNNMSSRVINASSSEIYKGHGQYVVKENDHNYKHLHPYSIGKIMGQSIVEFYRTTYGHMFSNAVLFTVESSKKSDKFLLNKVAKHAIKWKKTGESIVFGSLDSARSILHVEDVANAFYIISRCNYGDDYLVCSRQTHKILDLVKQIYMKNGIELSTEDERCYTSNTEGNDDNKCPVFYIKTENNGMDQSAICIEGAPTKLEKLGWTQTKQMEDILDEIVANK